MTKLLDLGLGFTVAVVTLFVLEGSKSFSYYFFFFFDLKVSSKLLLKCFSKFNFLIVSNCILWQIFCSRNSFPTSSKQIIII